MNTEQNKDPYLDLQFLSDQASPYLSPFHGMRSENQSHSLEQPLSAPLQAPSPIRYPSFLDIPPKNNQLSISIGESNPLCGDVDSPKSQSPVLQQNMLPIRHINQQENGIKGLIKFLVDNDHMHERDLMRMGLPLYQDSRDAQFIFQILMNKFSKLRKTKEEMTKYCMRKAFKFIAQMKTPQRKKSHCKSSKKDDSSTSLSFLQMPFKKNSQDKTMNSNFLKRVFSHPQFSSQYEQFLQNFSKLMQEDNESKIEFLAQMIEKFQMSSELDKIENIKRLPWTRSILVKTQELAHKLKEYGEGEYQQGEDKKQK